MIVWAVIVLPQPDSPTRPRVRPGAICRLTPSTAVSMPSSIGSLTRRSRISKRGACDEGPGSFIASPLPVGIGRVAQTVAEEVEGDHNENDQPTWNQEPGTEHQGLDVLSVEQERSQAHGGRAEAEPEEAQRDFAKDHLRHRQGEVHDEVTGETGEEVMRDDAPLTHATHL